MVLADEATTASSPGEILKVLLSEKVVLEDATKCLAFLTDIISSAIAVNLLPREYFDQCIENRISQVKKGATNEQNPS